MSEAKEAARPRREYRTAKRLVDELAIVTFDEEQLRERRVLILRDLSEILYRNEVRNRAVGDAA